MTGLDWEKKDILKEQKTLALQKIQEALVDFSSTAKKDIFDELVVKTSAEIEAEKEQKYVALRPVGLTHAPQDTQDYRKNLEDRAIQWDNDALKEMEFFQWKFAYNTDATVNLIELNETFCADLTGSGWRKNWAEAKIVAESKGYDLLTDYNDSDSERKKIQTDWYRLKQYFGKYANTWAITSMLGCAGRYWTGTKASENVVYARYFTKNSNNKAGIDDYYNLRVCGFKKMNIDA